MKYNIIVKTQIPAADEAELKTIIEAIESFVTTKGGTTEIVARTVTEVVPRTVTEVVPEE